MVTTLSTPIISETIQQEFLVTSQKRGTHANHYHMMIMDVRWNRRTTIIAALRNVLWVNRLVAKLG